MATVWDELAQKLRHVARGEVRRVGHRVESFRVRDAAPLTVESIAGPDVILELGDPDFDVEQAVWDYNARIGLAVGDILRVHIDPEGYTAVGVISESAVT